MGVLARKAFAVGDELFREKPLLSLPTVQATSQEEADFKAASQVTAIFENLAEVRSLATQCVERANHCHSPRHCALYECPK